MPEGPEICFSSKYINTVCGNCIFGGKIIKSEVSKCPEIDLVIDRYKITSKSRGKELMVTLTPELDEKKESLSILFHFGMSGVFKFTDDTEIPKHSHLRFFTLEENPPKVLSFVDYRRFGSWKITNEWDSDRGPDPVSEYNLFRENVLANLDDNSFKKPICETMLNQKYFNGIGNYLRAEILFRAGIEPFQDAKTVLNELNEVKTESPDILQLCHDVPLEVILLGTASIYDPEASKKDYDTFNTWLRCYNQPNMKYTKDHNKRTIWFENKAGPLKPKNASIQVKSEPKPAKIIKQGAKKAKIKKELSESEDQTEQPKPKTVKVENVCKRVTRSRFFKSEKN